MVPNNLTLTKKETVVLFDLLKLSSLPCSLQDMPTVTAREYAAISKALYSTGALQRSQTGITPDKGLEAFLLPLKLSNRALLFDYGEEETCLFRVCVYFSGRGVVAVRDADADKIDFLPIHAAEELQLLLPAVEEASSQKVSYFSYWIFAENTGTAHCAILNPATGQAKLTESVRKHGQAEVKNLDSTVSIPEYATMLKTRVKEICHVFDR